MGRERELSRRRGEEPNHARDRLNGGGQPFELSYQPGEEDWKRWLLSDAERTVGAEAERLHDATDDE